MVSSGTNTAPPGITIWLPSGIWMTRSRPLTRMSLIWTPAGRLTIACSSMTRGISTVSVVDERAPLASASVYWKMSWTPSAALVRT